MLIWRIILMFLIIINYSHSMIVLYYLFTKSNPDIPQTITDGTCIDKSKESVIIIHGYLAVGLGIHSLIIKDAFLNRKDLNVIIMDWSQNKGTFVQVVEYSKVVGKILGEQIGYVFENYNNLHIVGLGTGAHVAGFAAKHLKDILNVTIPRISALDAVSPLFNDTKPNSRLFKDDAKEVIVYHCDGNFLGISDPIGTVDFYINGGVGPQPGCKKNIQTFYQFLFLNINDMACNHNICRLYFTSTLNTNNTLATKCRNVEDFNSGRCDNNEKVIFGNNVQRNASGTYYLNYTQPYNAEELTDGPRTHV